MKMMVDGEMVIEILPWQKKLLEFVLPAKELEQDMKRRALWVWNHKVDQAFEALMNRWMPILRNDPNVTSIPTSKEAFVSLITSRPDYKDREAREALNDRS